MATVRKITTVHHKSGDQSTTVRPRHSRGMTQKRRCAGDYCKYEWRTYRYNGKLELWYCTTCGHQSRTPA